MQKENDMNRKKIAKWLAVPILAFLFLLAAGIWYVNDIYYSHADVQEYLRKTGSVTITETQNGLYLDGPGNDAAIIFYPGAKVEYTAYLPLLYKVSERGADCFLIKMPCNLAFLGKNKADDILASHTYSRWYLSGHSLGGAMAASYASAHLNELDGLILLAAYPTESLESEIFSVLSVYGSEDGVMNMDKLDSGCSFMPDAYREICIEGGNHAQFGDYGTQKGDHSASVSQEEQQTQTADAVINMIMESEQESERMEETALEYEKITAQRAKDLILQNDGLCILDVRTREEYQEGHIKGAICIPNEEILEVEPKELADKQQVILVYCRSGNRSRQAAQKLADMGYERVMEFGGLLDWPYPNLLE